MKISQDLRAKLEGRQRLAVLGRLRMAEWIEMREPDFAREIEKIEKDPLFRKLFFGTRELPGAIRRQRWPNGRLSGSFYEMNEGTLAKGERVQVESMLADRRGLAGMIRKMGRDAFERYFLHADEPLTLEEIARRTGRSAEEVRAIHDFLLEMGTRAEFELPERGPGPLRAYSCLAKLFTQGDEPGFEFFSPHWARGLYSVRYDLLEQWKASGGLPAQERRKLPGLLKRIETVNLRQSTLFRILESLSKLQARYLKEGDDESKRPISLRQLAQRLDLAPSTVSRALSRRSVSLPWGKEAPLISLVPGRRKVLREILARWLEEDAGQTDAVLAERLQSERAIRISRRTVNAVRHELRKSRA